MGKENEDEVAAIFGDFSDDDHKEDKDASIDVEAEGTKAKGLRQPMKPTRREVEDHELTHAEFRDWFDPSELCSSPSNQNLLCA